LDASFISKQMTLKMLVSAFAGFILMVVVLYLTRIAVDSLLFLVVLLMSAMSITYLLLSRRIHSRDGHSLQGLLDFFGTSDLYLTLMLFCSSFCLFYIFFPSGRFFSYTALSAIVLSIVRAVYTRIRKGSPASSFKPITGTYILTVSGLFLCLFATPIIGMLFDSMFAYVAYGIVSVFCIVWFSFGYHSFCDRGTV